MRQQSIYICLFDFSTAYGGKKISNVMRELKFHVDQFGILFLILHVGTSYTLAG